MRLLVLLPAFLAVALAGCDSTAPLAECPGGVDCPEPVIDPDTVDFDGITELNFERYVRPILNTRQALAPEVTDVTYAALLNAGPSSFLIPFDADASLLVRLAEETLTDDSVNPFPRLLSLQDDEKRYIRRWIEAGAPNASGQPAYADATRLLYICNQLAGRVSVVDVDRQRIIRNVYFEALGQPADAKPHHVIATPDGSAWYVALIAGDGGGSVLKLSSSLTMDPADADYLLASETPPSGDATFQKPGMLAFDAANQRLFAGRSFSADPTSSGIARFNASTLAFETIQTPDVHPHALGVSRDGRYVFTAGLTATSGATPAYVFEAATGDLVDQELVPGTLAFVHYAVSPDGETVVLTSQTGGALYVFDFDTASGDLTVRGSVPTGDQPWHPVYAPDGSAVYVPNRLSNTVTVVDPAALTVTRTIGGAGLPFSQVHGSALSADGSTLFVSSRNFAMMMGAMPPAAPEASGEMDHGGMNHEGMDHDADAASPGATPAMVMPEIAWTPSIRFIQADGTPEPNDLYGNVAMLDARDGSLIAVIQTGRWASGLALYEPR
ncbi:YncE family protein [Rubricoccus marinus]|uniref:SMP-30/Gluconolactonase/LRE-like region domain-containing protein n=1 Tax=Rubricoccus marinus TaxID=716817 RepID=A0A259TWQ1_9BACT|nr:beta-propeller fold lactonase family protein [Rubricoccus marinus]OZC02202.1 hypothetical protein BSZ36_03890 [Rubricoccus marinus]